MKHILLTFMLSIATVGASAQKLPAYLDTNRSVEERIDDAISRMTIQEKIRVIHAQSKFSSAGVPTALMVSVPTCCGTNGSRLGKATTRAWLFLPSPVLPLRGTRSCRVSTATVLVKRRCIVART